MTATDVWSSPPQTLKLERDEVHVWRASLDLEASSIQSLLRTLCVEEQQRAERFHFPKDRDRFIVARGLLRAILSFYLGKEPSCWRFVYNEYGKPALTAAYNKEPLCFNLSHSRELALYAVTQNRNLGVDLEYIRTDFPWEEIAERFFSPKENAVLRTLPQNMKHKAFFTCWTRKEAYIKATGKGLTLPLDQFDVSLIPGEQAMLLSIAGDHQAACHWSLQELIPDPDYVAALAVEGTGWQLKCWQWISE